MTMNTISDSYATQVNLETVKHTKEEEEETHSRGVVKEEDDDDGIRKRSENAPRGSTSLLLLHQMRTFSSRVGVEAE